MDVRKRRVSEICRRRCQRTEEDVVVLIGPMLDRGGGGWGSRVGGGTGLSWASRGESGWSWKGGGGGGFRGLLAIHAGDDVGVGYSGSW